jgi:hypothetical protein
VRLKGILKLLEDRMRQVTKKTKTMMEDRVKECNAINND